MPYDSVKFAIMESVLDIIDNVVGIPQNISDDIRTKMKTRGIRVRP